MKFALVGYDKDHDIYGLIGLHEDLEYLNLRGKHIAEIQEETDWFRMEGTNEPFDWFKIVDAEDAEYPEKHYWASYEN